MDIVIHGGMDGIETAGKIRSFFDIPVVFLTAYADEKTLERAKITEPFGYLIKPFKERELHVTIEIALYKHEMEKKLKEKNQWLVSVIESIGDAVIATDPDGTIRLMNPIAEALTGGSKRKL
jgi:CheY-like chemotaxis protein